MPAFRLANRWRGTVWRGRIGLSWRLDAAAHNPQLYKRYNVCIIVLYYAVLLSLSLSSSRTNCFISSETVCFARARSFVCFMIFFFSIDINDMIADCTYRVINIYVRRGACRSRYLYYACTRRTQTTAASARATRVRFIFFFFVRRRCGQCDRTHAPHFYYRAVFITTLLCPYCIRVSARRPRMQLYHRCVLEIPAATIVFFSPGTA